MFYVLEAQASAQTPINFAALFINLFKYVALIVARSFSSCECIIKKTNNELLRSYDYKYISISKIHIIYLDFLFKVLLQLFTLYVLFLRQWLYCLNINDGMSVRLPQISLSHFQRKSRILSMRENSLNGKTNFIPSSRNLSSGHYFE